MGGINSGTGLGGSLLAGAGPKGPSSASGTFGSAVPGGAPPGPGAITPGGPQGQGQGSLANPVGAPTNPNSQPTAPLSTPSGTSVLPPALTSAFQNSSQVFGDLGTGAMGLQPQADQFMSNLFSPQLNPQSQNYLNASANLGQQALNQQIQNLQGQFQASPYSSNMASATLDATNQFANQLNQVGSGLAQQQMWTAAGLAGQPFQQAFQSATAGPALQSQLFNTLQGESLAGLPPQALGMYSQIPASSPAVLQGATGKKG